MLSETPSTNGELLIEQGDLAGRKYRYEASVCKNPTCHCERVTLKFFSEMRETRPATSDSVCLDMDLERREIANLKDLKADPSTRALAYAVAAETGDEEWNQLRRIYWALKQYWTEHSDLEQAEVSFPPDILDGSMVAYYHVFPFARRIEFIHEQKTWAFDDQYCLNPRCSCQQAALTFLRLRQEPGRQLLRPTRAVYYGYGDGKISQVETGEDAQYSLPDLLESLKKARGDLDSLLAKRHALLRHLCGRDLKRRSRQTSQRIHPSTGKLGRNDPCPCGSGKKWKRCCGPWLEERAGLCGFALMLSREGFAQT